MGIKRDLSLDSIEKFKDEKEVQPIAVEFKKEIISILKKKVNSLSGVNVRKEADIDSEIIKVLKNDSAVEIDSEKSKNGFFKLANEEGWVKADFIK